MQRMRRRAFEAKPRVPLLGLLVDRMDEQGADPDQLAGLKDSCHAIKQQRAPEVLALMASIDRQATEQDDRHRLISRQSPRWPGRGFTRHDRTGRECVIAGDIWISLGRYEHTRAAAAMALEG